MQVNPERIAKGMYWERAWSLVEGCSYVSPGCDHCWSAAQAHMRAGQKNEKIRARYEGLTRPDGSWNGKIRLLTENLDLPLRIKKPTVWAVWNDLFHPDVPLSFIAEAFSVMRKTRQHLFLLLTKRPLNLKQACDSVWPKDCSHIWPGVTAENQEQADKRIPVLLQIPAAVKWVSCEPLLGPIDLYLGSGICNCNRSQSKLDGPSVEPMWDVFPECTECGSVRPVVDIDWCVVGGETGPGARPMHPDWVRSLRDQCLNAHVPFFLKSMGEFEAYREGPANTSEVKFKRVGKKKAGRNFGGREWNQFPEVEK